MKTIVMSVVFAGAAMASLPASAVEYVRICSLYGAGYHYVPGTDTCANEVTGDAREATGGGVWRSLYPYPAGSWVTSLEQECKSGNVVQVGKFKTSDFSVNAWSKMQTRSVPLSLKSTQFISKVFFSGGFYDPRLPDRSATSGTIGDGLCLRSVDSTVQETAPGGGSTINPPFGNDKIPLGCVSNNRIAGMQAAYAMTAVAAYPNIDNYFAGDNQTIHSGPYTYGKALVLTTDLGRNDLTYENDTTNPVSHPLMVGTVIVSVCVQNGVNLN